jgi:hypothetical protein
MLSLADFPNCIKLSLKKSRKSPPFQAKDCPEGLILDGENGKYIIKTYSTGKKWVKYKTPTKKISFDTNLPKNKKLQTREIVKNKEDFYTENQENMMKHASRNLVATVKSNFQKALLSKYSLEDVTQIMKNLNQKVQKLALQQKEKTFNLRLVQAKKYILESIVEQELGLLNSGKNTTLLILKK